MGWKASMIIIQNPNNLRDENTLLKHLGLNDFVYREDTVLDECIFPGDESINIGYFNNNIIICDDCQVIDNFMTEEIGEIESQLVSLFPTSEILSVACISTTNYHGYSLTKNGKKIRTKSLNADDGFYSNFGELIEEEKPIYSKSETVDGKRIWKYQELPNEVFYEDQMMEDFTFGVAKRLLGVRIDTEESDALMEDVVFKKYIKPINNSSTFSSPISMHGQWIGQFVYGPEYGEEMHGEKVQFRLFINEFESGKFKGTSVDIEGFGANMDTATINGFIADDFISFTKEYPDYFIIDDNGRTIKDPSNVKPRLSYEGHYNFRSKFFSGQWELWANEELAGEGSMVDIFTGTWEMTKDDQ
jgi:hypothetical protein